MLHIRHIEHRRDDGDILRINAASAEPWPDALMLDVLHKIGARTRVAIINNSVAGFVTYHINNWSIRIVKIAVDAHYRRNKVGHELVLKLIKTMRPNKIRQLIATVPERCVEGQLFFRACGLRCRKIKRDFFEHGDGYEFVFDAKTTADVDSGGVRA